MHPPLFAKVLHVPQEKHLVLMLNESWFLLLLLQFVITVCFVLFY